MHGDYHGDVVMATNQRRGELMVSCGFRSPPLPSLQKKCSGERTEKKLRGGFSPAGDCEQNVKRVFVSLLHADRSWLVSAQRVVMFFLIKKVFS